MAKQPDALIHIIAGPTASGKSAKALELAEEKDGVIINCDSLQIYDDLPILTARPGPKDLERAPHSLYGVLHPNSPTSAGNWRETALPMIERLLEERKTPIICGGTGLYIRALMNGLSPIPDIPPDIRDRTNARQQELGNPAFHAELEKIDPVMAARLGPHNKARLIRAYEIMVATGKSLAEWQAMPPVNPPAHWNFEIHKIMPERSELYRRCNERFLLMLEQGALDEAEEFSARIDNGDIRENVPLAKALGFRQLRAYIKGEMSKDEAIERAQAETRHYAKRQNTWFTHQL